MDNDARKPRTYGPRLQLGTEETKTYGPKQVCDTGVMSSASVSFVLAVQLNRGLLTMLLHN